MRRYLGDDLDSLDLGSSFTPSSFSFGSTLSSDYGSSDSSDSSDLFSLGNSFNSLTPSLSDLTSQDWTGDLTSYTPTLDLSSENGAIATNSGSGSSDWFGTALSDIAGILPSAVKAYGQTQAIDAAVRNGTYNPYTTTTADQTGTVASSGSILPWLLIGGGLLAVIMLSGDNQSTGKRK